MKYIATHRKRQLIFAILCFCCILIGPAIFAKENRISLTIDGYAADYQWAHASNRLAILAGTSDATPFLYIVDADRGAVIEKIALPTQEHIATFGWLPDDSGVLLATFNHKDGSGDFYQYRFAEKTFAKVYEKVERIYAQPTSIVMDHGSSYWAATYVGEGHPDVAIYQEDTMIVATDVYPNTITAARWKEHQLYCITGAYLEYGLTREQRRQHPQFSEENELGRDEAVVYALEPTTTQARLTDVPPASLFDVSHDNMYELAIEQGEQSFVLTWH